MACLVRDSEDHFTAVGAVTIGERPGIGIIDLVTATARFAALTSLRSVLRNYALRMTAQRFVHNRRPTRARLLGALAAAAITFVLALLVQSHWPGESVPLLAGAGRDGHGGCYLNFAVGRLLVDPVAGTAIEQISPHGGGIGIESAHVTPVMWPTGFTGRRSGSEVEVLDRQGQVVARTGSNWRLQGGYEGDYWLTCAMIPPMENWTIPPYK